MVGKSTLGLETTIFSAHGVHSLAPGATLKLTFASAVLGATASASEFAGLDATGALDRQATAGGQSPTPSSGATATTSRANELLLGAFGSLFFSTTPPTFTPGTGYTALPGGAGVFTPIASLTIDPESQVVTNTGTFTATGTYAPPVEWAAALATYRAHTATRLQVTASARTASPSSPFQLTVTAVDASGARAAGYTGTVEFGGAGGRAGLPARYTFTSADYGTHTFPGVTLTTPGPQVFTATDVLTVSISGQSPIIENRSGIATHFLIKPLATHVAANTPVRVTITALDAHNAPAVYSVTVHFTSSSAHAVLPNDVTILPGTGATRTLNHFLFHRTGTFTITATDQATGITGASPPITVVPFGSVTRLTVQPAALRHGQKATLTAHVSGPAAAPRGVVQFFDVFQGQTRRLGSAALRAGTAALHVAARVGVHRVFALYVGDASHGASQSASRRLTVHRKAGH